MNTLKPGTVAAVLFLVLLLAGCKNLFHPEEPEKPNTDGQNTEGQNIDEPNTGEPNTDGPKNNDDGKTRVYFVNTGNDFSVTVYSDSSRLVKFADMGANAESGMIETEPNPGAVFYIRYRILIDDVTLAYDGPGLYARIDAEKTTRVTIPLLSELDAVELSKPVTGQVHIKIQNAGTSTLVLRQGASDVIPQEAGSPIINSGETAQYAVDGGPVSGYSFMKNTVTSLAFPAGLTDFVPGRLYSFKFDGTTLTLLADKPLTVAQALLLVPPENISAKSLANGHISLTWDRVGTETGYGIYRSGSETGTYTSIGRTDVTSYTDTMVTNGSTYYYRISAVQNNMETEQSNTVVSALAEISSLPSPQGLSVTGQTENSISLSWQTVSGATSYKVYKGSSSSAVNQYVAEIASTLYTVTGLVANTTYYFTVSTVNISVESLPATTVQGKTSVVVTFNADGGNPATQTRMVMNGDSLGSSNMPPVPNRNGDVFNGWYTAANGGGSEFTAATPVTGDITVYAWWKMPDNLSLDAALTWIRNYAVTGDVYTLTLKTDETIAPRSLDYGGKKVGITLSGGTTERTVSLSTTGSLFTVESGVTLTLDNNITLQGRSDNTAPLVVVLGGTLVMNTGSKISGNIKSSPNHGGGVYIYGGTFTMSGGEISGNTSSSSYSTASGGGVYIHGGTFTMSSGKISGNTSSSSPSSSFGGNLASGGGVYVDYNGIFTMGGGTISDNISSISSYYSYYSTASGGGVSIDGGTFTMNNGTISDNIITFISYPSSSSGGGVYVGSGTFTMNNGTISDNTSSSSGGGVSIGGGTFTMSGGTISGHTSSAHGGGVYVGGGTFTKQSGGIIYGSNESNNALRNTATSGDNFGHAVYVFSSPAKKRNTTAGSGVTLNSNTAGSWE
jgi:uncharacterized repeat protein (TIGR02543 family)